MDRRTRICLWIILAGLANFLLYAALYAFVYGEAVNGWVVAGSDGPRFFLQSGREVSRAVFVYSGVHSISIWPTVGAIMLAMLTLAKDRVADASLTALLPRRLTLSVLAAAIALVAVVMTFLFIVQFSRRFSHPLGSPPPQVLQYRESTWR